MRSYIVTKPMRGTITVCVEATSAAEAVEKAAAGEGALDSDVSWTGEWRAVLDEGARAPLVPVVANELTDDGQRRLTLACDHVVIRRDYMNGTFARARCLECLR